MGTHERKIRIAWVERDEPAPAVVPEAPPAEAPAVVDETDRRTIEAAHERMWSICLWVGVCGAFLFLDAWFLPAFVQMFREVGVHLPWLTEAVLGTPRWLYAFGVLSLLHAAAVTPDAETRGQLRVAAFFAVVFGVGVTMYALFLPLISLTQKL